MEIACSRLCMQQGHHKENTVAFCARGTIATVLMRIVSFGYVLTVFISGVIFRDIAVKFLQQIQMHLAMVKDVIRRDFAYPQASSEPSCR